MAIGASELDEPLSSIWLHSPGRTFALSQATNAMALVVATVIARGTDAPHIYVPDYICNGALVHARAGRCRVSFYPITDDMRPDWPTLRQMAAEDPPDLFALAHYFGVVNDLSGARAFCDEQSCLLHEDAVHVLRPVGGIGTVGDFVSYSPRKFLDVPDGAVLAVQGKELSATATEVASRLPSRKHSSLRWSLLRLKPRRQVRTGPLPPMAIDDEIPAGRPKPSMWMSALGRRRLRKLHDDGTMERVAAEQRAVVDEIARKIAPRFNLSPLPAHPDATPYMCAMRAYSQEQLENALGQLRQAGALAATWPELPPEVWQAPDRHAAALRVRRTLLRFIPRPSRRRRPLDFLDHLQQQPAE